MRTTDNRRERCLKSGKIKHTGRKQALTACSLAPVPLKPYKCPHCGYWHVTKVCPALRVMGF